MTYHQVAFQRSDMVREKKTTYAREEAMEASTAYFGGDELAAKAFVTKYALRDAEGNLLEKHPPQAHRRMARELARVEARYPNPMSEDEIYGLLSRPEGRELGMGPVVPQGSPMSAVGNPYKVQSLSNCFVIPSPEDSYGGILLADQQEAQIMKRRGGVGFDISSIRPRGMRTLNAAGTTDGLSVFMERYSNTCREVGQGGRRGALMLTVDVRHPEVCRFVNAKRDRSKVTGANVSVRVTDEFMYSLSVGGEYTQRWPVDAPEGEALIERRVKTKDVWEQIIDAAWDSAEPGVLFWDNVTNFGPADAYKAQGYGSISTNPCFSGDTMIAVADGRNAVSIKQLADEGEDVDVYSVDPKTGLVSIKRARNPRVTGVNQKLVRVWLDDGSFLDTTPEHKFLTLEGEKVEARDLKVGQSLPRFLKRLEPVEQGKKDYLQVVLNTRDATAAGSRTFEHRLVAQRNYPERWDELYDEQKKHGWVEGGLVVHHKDHDPLNNAPGNLEVMTWSAHAKLHGVGFAGESNPRYIDVANEELERQARELTKQLGRRFSNADWESYASARGLPTTLSLFRQGSLGTLHEVACRVARELGLEHVDVDPRLVRTLASMLEQGYQARVDGRAVLVRRKCEWCGGDFEVEHVRREFAFCCHEHAMAKVNSDAEFHARRTSKTVATYAGRAPELRRNQARVWSELKFKLGRDPMLKEWEAECATQGVARRLKTKFGFKSWEEVSRAGADYNHKVLRVEELPGEHTVYNLTVDDHHTVAVITKIGDPTEKNRYDGVIVANCGEITLSAWDSCRLMVVDLTHFVERPFTKEAEFDFARFDEVVGKAQRLMDDLVDLEIEAIDRILAKVAKDPESEEAKAVEVSMWRKIRDAAAGGRRTGLGVTGLGDATAMLGVRYGSSESVHLTDRVYRALCLGAYRSTVRMAQERGAFPIHDNAVDFAHRFLIMVSNEDASLKAEWLEHGRRNIALTTTAPVGTVSMLTQTTSGIEPAFLLQYKRRKKLTQDEIDHGARVDLTDKQGDRWQEHDVYHHCYRQWMRVANDTFDEASPYWKATSADVDWVASVDVQAAAQRWICHSISKTCNLPRDASHELVSEVYQKAWKSGCKGFTIYREGSRDGVLVSEAGAKFDLVKRFEGVPADEARRFVEIGREHAEWMPAAHLEHLDAVEAFLERGAAAAQPAAIAETHAPKRPKTLECDIHRASVKGEGYLVLVGLFEDKPYEVFCGLSDKVEVPKKFKRGKLLKNGKKDGLATYNLLVPFGDDDDLAFKDVVSLFDNPTYGSFTRMLSLSLRHGVPVQYVVEQCQKHKHDDMTSFSRVIARVLKSYIPDGTKPASEKSCSSCGSENVTYQEGCVVCLSCGSSKCG